MPPRSGRPLAHAERLGSVRPLRHVRHPTVRRCYLVAAVVGPRGLRDALLLNQGDGRFLEAAAAFGLPLDQASLGVAAADFDADRQIDLFLTGVGKNRLLRNKDGKGFEDQTQSLKTIGPPAISLMALA